MAAAQKNLSHDPMYDILLNYDDAANPIKLLSVVVNNRYTDQNLNVRIDPVDPNTGVEDTTREISQTFPPGASVTFNIPTSGSKSITLVFNSKGSLVGYDTYFGTSAV